MTRRLDRSAYVARMADSADDVIRAQRLRYRAFRGGTGGLDIDRFDGSCRHLLVERRADRALVCCCRVMVLASGREVRSSYSAQFYDLPGLAAYPRPLAELGRFCVAPEEHDPDILRVALAALVEVTDRVGAGLLFGCASFAGTDPAPYRAAFALLASRHLAPPGWMPGPKAPAVYRFADGALPPSPGAGAAMAAMPPLLRSYLGLGGWVSDHAVIDTDLNTLHVLTGVEVAGIPAGRARVLRRMTA